MAAAARRVVVDGQVDGDIFAAATIVDLRGPVGDSTRVAAQDLTVGTTIDGDLVAAVTELHLLDSTHLTGGIAAFARLAEIDGTVDGDVRVAAGEIIVRGTLRGDARLIADRVDLAPGARIEGDLVYASSTPLDAEAAARVAGTVQFDVAAEEEQEDSAGGGASLFFWLWQTGAALVTGLLMIALFRGIVQRLATAIAGEATVGGLLGFGAFLVVPAGAVVAMVTLIGLPLGIAVLLLFAVALYVAKLPVAVWVGGRLLGLAGRPAASPYAALAVGILGALPALRDPLCRVADLARRHVAGTGRHGPGLPRVPAAAGARGIAGRRLTAGRRRAGQLRPAGEQGVRDERATVWGGPAATRRPAS